MGSRDDSGRRLVAMGQAGSREQESRPVAPSATLWFKSNRYRQNDSKVMETRRIEIGSEALVIA
jgi:hypothetical protein